MSSDNEKTRKQILAEHQEIMELTSRMENTTDQAELLDSLQRLRPLFERHFAREEGLEGLHGDIQEHAPQEAAAIDQLKDDHRQLLADVSALEAQVKACQEGPIKEKEIRTSCNRFLRMLKEHEARENDVFLDAIWTDLGQGD
jgi:hemerythrin